MAVTNGPYPCRVAKFIARLKPRNVKLLSTMLEQLIDKHGINFNRPTFRLQNRLQIPARMLWSISEHLKLVSDAAPCIIKEINSLNGYLASVVDCFSVSYEAIWIRSTEPIYAFYSVTDQIARKLKWTIFEYRAVINIWYGLSNKRAFFQLYIELSSVPDYLDKFPWI